MLIGVERDAVFMRKRGELSSDPDQPRDIVLWIAIELELEIARAGVFASIGHTAFGFDLVVEADGMADCDTLEPVTTHQGEKLRNVISAQVARQPRIEACDIFGHAVKEVEASATEQRIQNRLVDFGRTIGRGKRWDVFFCASLELRPDARRMQTERRLEPFAPEIKLPRDQKRTPQFVDRRLGRKVRTLVEPFRRQQFGAGADERAPTLDLDLGAHERLARVVDHDRAEVERPGEADRPFEERNIAHSQTRRHGAS